MELSELLRKTVMTLEELGVRYFVGGSIASTYYAEPRFTHDIDIIADLQLNHVKALCAAFLLPGFYVSEDAARDAVVNHFQFNIIDSTTGYKIDIIVPPNTPRDRAAMQRRRRVVPPGAMAVYEASFASPEDVILSKLAFHKEGGGEKHLRDIASILRIRRAELDLAYITDWAQRLGVVEIWQALLRAADASA
jgi:hypothetical protein